MSDFDMKLTCVDCGREFDFPVEEQRYFMRNGYSMPKRCRECRTSGDAKMPASVMAAALAAQQKASMERVEHPEPVMETPVQTVAPQMAEPVRPEPVAEPVAEPYRPEPVAEPVYEPAAPQMAEPITAPAEPAPQPTPQPATRFYLLVDGNKYVSIDNVKKMVNIRADMKDIFDTYEEAEEWKDFLADKGVVALIKEAH